MRKLIIIALLFVFVPLLSMADFFGSGAFGHNTHLEIGYNFPFLVGSEIDLYSGLEFCVEAFGAEREGLFYIYDIESHFGGKIFMDWFLIEVEYFVSFPLPADTYLSTNVSIGFEF